jgi:mannose-1-phosphate guanylyltransferase/phosphomannomutase
VIETIAAEKAPLSRIIAGLPESHTVTSDVPCAWEAKGRVMRSLLEEFASDDEKLGMAPGVDLTDGVKVQHPEGWSLVLPDADTPYFHVYSEGTSPEIAEELAGIYRQKILDLSGIQLS